MKPTPIQKWLAEAKKRFNALPPDEGLELHISYPDAERLAGMIGVSVLDEAPTVFVDRSIKPGQLSTFLGELNWTASKFETQTARGIYPFHGDVLRAVKAIKAELGPLLTSLNQFSTTPLRPPGFFTTLRRPTLKPVGDGSYKSELVARIQALRKLMSETLESLEETEKAMRAKARSPRRKYPGLEPAAYCLIIIYERRTGKRFTHSPYQWKQKGVVPVHIKFVQEALKLLTNDVPEAAIFAAIRAANADYRKRSKIAQTGGVAPGSE